QPVEILPVERQDDAPLGDRQSEHVQIRGRFIRPAPLLNRGDVVPEGAQRNNDRNREVLVGVELRHLSLARSPRSLSRSRPCAWPRPPKPGRGLPPSASGSSPGSWSPKSRAAASAGAPRSVSWCG